MLTHTTMHSVQVWVQTEEPTTVYLEYWLESAPETKWTSAPITTATETAHVAKLKALEGIEPGQVYGYRVLTPILGDPLEISPDIPMSFQSKPRWRFVPDEAEKSRHSIFDYRIAIGSCVYINEEGADREGGSPYGGNYEIFDVLAAQEPDIMLWMGDNVYYRENDYEHREGLIHRWTHDRQMPKFLPVFANTINYATWDDHDYGPNDLGRNYWLKEDATEIFQLMWGNPTAGLPETPGIFTYVNWGDANIYLLDNRTYQAPVTGNPEAFDEPKPYFGKEQIDWLIDQLVWTKSQSKNNGSSYPSRFNLIVMGSQALNTSDNPYSFYNATEEWQYLMDRIVAEGIRGVIFLSGDVHFGEVNKIEHTWKDKTSSILEVTSSPMTAGSWPGHQDNEARLDIFPGEMDRVGERNFVTLDFEGPLNDRTMTIRYWNAEGKLLNQEPGATPGTVTEASIIKANDL
jgi:alkaline phosphatase D